MKKINEWRVGDIVKRFSHKGFICEVNKDSYTVIWDWEAEVDYEHNVDYDIVNLSATGRKAALASSKKVGRDSKGRFESIKVDMWKATYGAVHMSSTLSGQRELLRNHENRIRALEKKGK